MHILVNVRIGIWMRLTSWLIPILHSATAEKMQKTANITRIPSRNDIDRNLNLFATFLKTTAAFCQQNQSQNRREQRLEPHRYVSKFDNV